MKKTRKTTTVETQKESLEVQLAKPGKPGELTRLEIERLDTAYIPRYPKLDYLEAYRRWRGHRAGLAMLSASARTTRYALTEGVSKDEKETHFVDKGVLVIGTGGGTFGNPTKESREESKGIKMAEKLGLDLTTSVRKMNQTLKRLLEQDGGQTELPAIFRALPHVVKREFIPDIYCYIGDAIQDGDIARLSKKEETQGLGWYYDAWKKKEAPVRGYTDEKVFSTLDALIKGSIERRRTSHIELSSVIQCIFMKDRKNPSRAQDKVDAEKEKLIFNLISALYLNEVLYWQAIELCKAAERHPILMTDPKGKTKEGRMEYEKVKRSAVYICDANPTIARASHHESVPRMDFLVVQNSHTRNYGIYVSRDLPKCHNLVNLWRMIQALELLKMGWDPREIPWTALSRWKQHDALEGIWSCFMRDGKFDNGLFKEDFRPSEIAPKEILDIIGSAFHYLGGIRQWQWKHHIPVVSKVHPAAKRSEDTKTAQPAPGVKPAIDTSSEAGAQAPADEKRPEARKARGTKSAGVKAPTSPISPIPVDQRGNAGDDLATALAKAGVVGTEEKAQAAA